jgi:hypothetical protein
MISFILKQFIRKETPVLILGLTLLPPSPLSLSASGEGKRGGRQTGVIE